MVESTFEKPVHLASNAVAINFFDNTSGWLPRHDCLPFVENFAALHSRKAKLPTFLAASRVRPFSALSALTLAPPGPLIPYVVCALGRWRGGPG